MITTNLTGNLGNHMWQYAVCRSVAEKLGYDWGINSTPSHDYHNGANQMYFLDVDKNRDLAIKYGVKSIPAIKTFNGATLIETSVGVVSEGRINELVKNLLV